MNMDTTKLTIKQSAHELFEFLDKHDFNKNMAFFNLFVDNTDPRISFCIRSIEIFGIKRHLFSKALCKKKLSFNNLVQHIMDYNSFEIIYTYIIIKKYT